MRVLLLAYACEPGQGSESGVGWNWAHMAAATGYDVTVFTRSANRPAIEASDQVALHNVRFEYYELPNALLRTKRRLGLTRAYYLAWCVGARRVLKQSRYKDFDLYHHVTWATAMMPSALPPNARPQILGPLGGGVRTPWVSWRLFGARGVLYEAMRTLSLGLARWNPLLRSTWRRATLTLAQNEDTARLLAKGGGSSIHIYPNAGIEAASFVPRIGTAASPRLPQQASSVQCVFAGRLVHWKGAEVAVRAAILAAERADVRLDVYGDGPTKNRLLRLVRRSGLGDRIRLHGAVPRVQVLAALQNADYYLLPSLHDEGPLGVPEAMACGAVPVVLNRGGPVVSTGGVAEMIDAGRPDAMARRMSEIISTPPTPAKRKAVVNRAALFDWTAKREDVASFYALALRPTGL